MPPKAYDPLPARHPDVGFGQKPLLPANAQPPRGSGQLRHRFYESDDINENWHQMRIAIKHCEESPTTDAHLIQTAETAINTFFAGSENAVIGEMRLTTCVALFRRLFYYVENSLHLNNAQICTIWISIFSCIHAGLETLPANLVNPIQAKAPKIGMALIPLLALFLDRFVKVPKAFLIPLCLIGGVACSAFGDWALWYFTLPEKKLKELPNGYRKYGNWEIVDCVNATMSIVIKGIEALRATFIAHRAYDAGIYFQKQSIFRTFLEAREAQKGRRYLSDQQIFTVMQFTLAPPSHFQKWENQHKIAETARAARVAREAEARGGAESGSGDGSGRGRGSGSGVGIGRGGGLGAGSGRGGGIGRGSGIGAGSGSERGRGISVGSGSGRGRGIGAVV
ncbi:hypothetical protein BJ508DRAFT_331947 [Ascobolus immersus RN42]|uniref:Uncharacterized protein n=1 Tax=Ascobolus immersus RN42 TaxID=1160509 RepID=A0A3N4HUH3_ASCIM|nr:hypothetical protein BJ508DRAFT_331947 [Ascobolus immersus RN42]